MRRIPWLTLALALSASAATAQVESTAYAQLGDVPVMASGRVKPLDTYAREEIKQLHGRETIKLTDQKDKVVGLWPAVAALIDIPARPEFWDKQDVLLVEYLPLKQRVLHGSVRKLLEVISADKGLDEASRGRFAAASKSAAFDPTDLAELSLVKGLTGDRAGALRTFAWKLDQGHKFLSAEDLNGATVEVDGKEQSFVDWFAAVNEKGSAEGAMGTDTSPLTMLEKKVREVGVRLFHYEAARDRNPKQVDALDLLVMPRPASRAYIAYLGEVFEKARDRAKFAEMSPLGRDAVRFLGGYLNERQAKDRAQPGSDAEFDRLLTEYLRDKAPWLPMRLVLTADAAELARAGFDPAKLAAYRGAVQALDAAEAKAPGTLDPQVAGRFVVASRELGDPLGGYPSLGSMSVESHFNRLAPFWWSTYAYGIATILLLVSMGITPTPGTRAARIDRVVYWSGLGALAAGIGLEVYGFVFRVLITGWAPVTNMYETVIYVGLISALLGAAMEAVSKKKYAATAAAIVALVMTALAAGSPSVLDPNIKALQPVLRSNYWLTIHVMTEVASYGAFALAMVLGLIATGYYLTATYRRPVGVSEYLTMLIPGIPITAAGGAAMYASWYGWGPEWFNAKPFFLGSTFAAMAGGAMVLGSFVAVAFEGLSRVLHRDDASLDEAALAGTLASGATPPKIVGRPTVDQIRALSAATPAPKLDARALAMQVTAMQIKPLANFIYRAMQVGVLLVTAGTILGGIWADYSWGRFWGWDPKEVWALITLLVYLVPLHGRFAGVINSFGLVAASVACFLSVVMAWYGVNFILGVGLHSYGFVEDSKGQEYVLAACTGVLGLVVGAGWRRHLGLKSAGA